MRFDLRSLIKRLRPGTRRSHLTFKDIVPPQTKMDALAAIMQRPVTAWWQGCRDRLMPVYRRGLEQSAAREASQLVLDDLPDDVLALRTELDAVSLSIDQLIDQLVPELRGWAASYEALHRGRWGASLQPSGIQLGTLLGPADVADTVETSIQANVALIRNLSSEAQAKVEGIIFRGFQSRAPATDIAKQLSEALGMSRARARRIAQDQTVKLSSELDTARMKQAGIEEFTWIHSGKIHARPWHRARNGKRFQLEGEIEPDDMPGVPVYCGCRKRAELPLE